MMLSKQTINYLTEGSLSIIYIYDYKPDELLLRVIKHLRRKTHADPELTSVRQIATNFNEESPTL